MCGGGTQLVLSSALNKQQCYNLRIRRKKDFVFIVAPPLTMKAKKPKRLTQREIEERLDQVWQETLQSIGLVASPSQAKKLMVEVGSLERSVGVQSGLKFGMALEMRNWGKALAKKRRIKNEQQLVEAIQELKRVGDEMPSLIRKGTKQFMGTLPRKGGPGRQPKLSQKDAAQACDQIALFIRQKDNLKQALQKVADLSSALFGKKVGARTLQKAWDKRSEQPTK